MLHYLLDERRTGHQAVHSGNSAMAAAVATGAAVLVPPAEADALIATLEAVAVSDIGSDAFVQSFCVDLERLALQAHLSAAGTVGAGAGAGAGTAAGAIGNSQEDWVSIGGGGPTGGHEYVLESLLLEGKVETLVRTLLALELWRTRVLFARDAAAVSEEGSSKKAHQQQQQQQSDVILECDDGGAFDIDEAAEKDNADDAVEFVGPRNISHGSNDSASSSSSPSDDKMPALAPLLAENKNSLRAAFILHSETTIVSLLSLIFYRREAFDELPNDVAIALVDYCARCMTSLAVPLDNNPMIRRQKCPESAADLADRIRSRTTLEEISDSALDAQYKTCIAAVSLAQYLCENIDALPLSARSRILDTHDFPVLIVPLIEEPPWTRRRVVTRRSGGDNGNEKSVSVWEKYIGGNWAEVASDELLRLTKCEAQPWLLVFHLLCTPSCREAYGLGTYRKEQIARLRKYLNNILVDQLPVLSDVTRCIDELSIMNVPETASTGHGTALLMQQIDSLREEVSSTVSSWDALPREQFDRIFSKVQDISDQTLRLISDIYGDGGYERLLLDGESPSTPLNSSTGMPIVEVVIAIARTGETEDLMIDCFKLALPGKENSSATKIVDSPHGSFRRIKCKVNLLDGSDASVLVIPPDAKLEAKIYFDGFTHTPNTLEVANLKLPTTMIDVKAKKEWRQAGRLEEKLVVQLGFKIMPVEEGNVTVGPQWTLNQAFISQPA